MALSVEIMFENIAVLESNRDWVKHVHSNHYF